MNLFYLASPYTPRGITNAEDAWRVREERYQAACKAAAALMRLGRVIFCPIAMSHGIDAYFAKPGSGSFWQRQDEPYLEACTGLIVLKLPGWEHSDGVAHEIAIARQRGITIEYFSPQQLEDE